MRLYFHTDRIGMLREGDILGNRRYPKGNVVDVLGPVIDGEFSNHLQHLFGAGLSYHGYHYLHTMLDEGNKTPFGQWTVEIYFEYMRFKHFADKPSRFTSFFCWGSFEDAQEFAKSSNRQYAIFEVENEGRCFIADMNSLKLDFDYAKQEENALKYWNGKPMSGDLRYKPKWEYIIDTPVKIVRHII